jgi:DNA-binding IclR family transcriptional regulator
MSGRPGGRAEPERATSVRRAVELLLALGSDEALDDGGLGVKRLTERLSDEKSRVSRTLQTLQEYGLVERDRETLAFRIGWQVYALAERAGDARLLAAAPGIVSGLVGELREATHLSVLDGTRVLTVVSQPPPRAVTAVSSIGAHVPAHCTSSGRALLLDHDLPELERAFGAESLPPAGPRAPRTVAQLHKRIQAARAVGYAAVSDESEAGLVAVAAPVRDHRGRIAAALNVSAPAFRFEERLAEAGQRLLRAADELGRAVGWATDQRSPSSVAGPPRVRRR